MDGSIMAQPPPAMQCPVLHPVLLLDVVAGECKRERAPPLFVGIEPAVAIVITGHGWDHSPTSGTWRWGRLSKGLAVCTAPFCVSGPRVAAATPTNCSSPCITDRSRVGIGGRLIPPFVRERPRDQQVSEAQVVGHVQQGHPVPVVGPHSTFIPAPDGVGIGPDAPGDLRPRQARFSLKPLQPLREVGRQDVDCSAVVNPMSRHRACPSEYRSGEPFLLKVSRTVRRR